MFALGIYLGILSYVIFGLGLVGLLYKPLIIGLTVISVIFFIVYNVVQRHSELDSESLRLRIRSAMTKQRLLHFVRNDGKWNKIIIVSFLFILVQSLVNLIGALGPELGFDALWYHLTLPKLYLLHHAILHIPGGLFYYSDMPKLTEMLYVIGLSLGSEIFPKLIHFGFGILCLFAIYKLATKFFSPRVAILVPLILASNLVFGWESVSAYIDLVRTFFEILALWAFMNWIETKKDSWFIESAVFLGLAITTKLLAIGSLFIFVLLIVYICKQRKFATLVIFKYLLSYILISFLIPLPWYVFSYLHTGNPFFPFFSPTYRAYIDLNPLRTWTLFTTAADPVSPIYLAFLPFVILFWKKVDNKFHVLFLYSGLCIVVWLVTPDTGGGRFILPYLPVLSIVVMSLLTISNNKIIKQSLIIFIFLITFISIGYRTVANAKFVPVLIGRETKTQFLASHLNFSFGDFVDSDGYFKSHIKPTDRVLLYGFHNEYYVDFPFIDSSYVKKGDVFDYITVQNGGLPKRFHYWNLIYMNPITHMALYSAGGLRWTY